jgi:hypothetical protein
MQNWARLERWALSASATSILTKHISRFRELMLHINDKALDNRTIFCGGVLGREEYRVVDF